MFKKLFAKCCFCSCNLDVYDVNNWRVDNKNNNYFSCQSCYLIKLKQK